MRFNKGYEEKRFEKNWEEIRKQYEEAGMDEVAIQSMYEYDRIEFNHMRRFKEHNQYISDNECTENAGESGSILFVHKYFNRITSEDTYFKHDDFLGWVEEIEDKATYTYLKSITKDNLTILTYSIMEEKTQEEIAEIVGISRSSVRDRLKRMKNNLKKLI